MKACQKTTAFQEAMEANIEKTEPDPGMMQSIAEREVALKEDAVVKSVKGRKKRYRGRKPAAGRRGEPEEIVRDCGSGRKLAAACRKVFSCATVAYRKRNLLRKIGTQENCGPRKEFTAAGMRKGTECKNGIRDQGLRQQLRGKIGIKDLGDRRPLYVRKKRATAIDIGG
jgi:hypothetical protein